MNDTLICYRALLIILNTCFHYRTIYINVSISINTNKFIGAEKEFSRKVLFSFLEINFKILITPDIKNNLNLLKNKEIISTFIEKIIKCSY